MPYIHNSQSPKRPNAQTTKRPNDQLPKRLNDQTTKRPKKGACAPFFKSPQFPTAHIVSDSFP